MPTLKFVALGPGLIGLCINPAHNIISDVSLRIVFSLHLNRNN